ncbi:MAG: RNA-guided endonuclease IscB [Ruthenibacterium sp.]
MVYVLNQDSQPLMPTSRYGHIRKLLKSGKAVVVKRTPFTVRLTYETENITQPITLGVDAGSKHIGLSASTEEKELYAGELAPRNDVVGLLSARRGLRRGRRNRKTRYRKPRFKNRVKSKHKGWLAPSVEVKVQEHITAIKRICGMLPITKVVVETAEFDTQRLKAMLNGMPLPVGVDYQLGEMYNAYNVRQYVLKRDNYACQCCGAQSSNTKKEVKFHVHHLESRKVGGNAPNNLITLCKDCHDAYHAGKITLDSVKKRGKPMRDAAFMGIMRKTLLARLRAELSISVSETYGYITKLVREQNNLKKTHALDALCIAGHPKAKKCDDFFAMKAVRHHNRQLYRAKTLKGGVRKRNQAPYLVKGFRLWDKVLFQDKECFITGRRATGYFALKTLDGAIIHNSASYKKLRFLEPAQKYIIEMS